METDLEKDNVLDLQYSFLIIDKTKFLCGGESIYSPF